MALPWVRVDANIAMHDKILDLLERRNGRAIAFSYICAIAYSGANGTDGHIPFRALPFIHASKKDAEALVEVELFDPHATGWTIRNYGERQQLQKVTSNVRAAQSAGAQKANCIRHHGKECGCWQKKVA